MEKFVYSVHKFRDLNQMSSIKFTDIVPFKFSVLLRFVVFLETSLESVHEKRAQIEVESPEGKKKKKRKPNERRNQSAQKTINPEENEDKIQQGKSLTYRFDAILSLGGFISLHITLIIKELNLANLFQVSCC